MIGQILKNRRKAMGLSMMDVKEATGIFPTNYCKYESEKMSLKNHVIGVKLGNLLGINSEYIEAVCSVDRFEIPVFLREDREFMDMMYKRCEVLNG